ncbi:MAG: hypothetical protein ACLRPT_01265 [Akkermansia muciniphila]
MCEDLHIILYEPQGSSASSSPAGERHVKDPIKASGDEATRENTGNPALLTFNAVSSVYHVSWKAASDQQL